MKKTNSEKGITLIALIITIVVLVILAVVTISSIQNDGIVGKANEAKTKYEQAASDEKTTLQQMTEILDGIQNENSQEGNNENQGSQEGNESGDSQEGSVVYKYTKEEIENSSNLYAIGADAEGIDVVAEYNEETKCLTISNNNKNGAGMMKNFTSGTSLNKSINTNIEKVVIEEGVINIGDYAFYNCTELTNITISKGVTTIGDSAFNYCNKLTSLTIPKSVTSIEENAFSVASGLTSIQVDANNSHYTSDNGILFNKDKTTILRYPSNKTDIQAYIIPNSVVNIAGYAFQGNKTLTSITIPEGVTSIGVRVFMSCKSLTSITIPEGVTSIGDSAFGYCESLTNITIPEGVTSIGASAFANCSALTSITIPSSVTTMGEDSIGDCKSLTSITFGENFDITLETIDRQAFCDTSYIFDTFGNDNTSSENSYPCNYSLEEVVINGKTRKMVSGYVIYASPDII